MLIRIEKILTTNNKNLLKKLDRCVDLNFTFMLMKNNILFLFLF